MEILHFIFSSFWIWLGTVILFGGASSLAARCVQSIIGMIALLVSRGGK